MSYDATLSDSATALLLPLGGIVLSGLFAWERRCVVVVAGKLITSTGRSTDVLGAIERPTTIERTCSTYH